MMMRRMMMGQRSSEMDRKLFTATSIVKKSTQLQREVLKVIFKVRVIVITEDVVIYFTVYVQSKVHLLV